MEVILFVVDAGVLILNSTDDNPTPSKTNGALSVLRLEVVVTVYR